MRSKQFVRYGIPFFTLVFGGAIGLIEFSKVRYEHRKQQPISQEEFKKLTHGIKMKDPKEITIEKEFERIQELDIDTWENKRGPRPWEENVNN